MTNLEAQALADRLARVWGPIFVHPLKGNAVGGLIFETTLKQGKRTGVDLTVSTSPDGGCYACMVYRHGKSQWVGILQWVEEDSEITVRSVLKQYEKSFNLFVSRWLPPFRRGLFLSGAQIEATAHEKTEWLVAAVRGGVLSEQEARALLGEEVRV